MLFNKRYKPILLLQVFLMLSFSEQAFATIRLPAIFSDHMVLQQKSKVMVWGWAKPAEKVSVHNSWSNKTVSTITGIDGQWKIWITTPAAGGPYTLNFKGENSIELKDVLLGEVWLCSGQSNMVFSLKSSDNAAQEIQKANYPTIRYCSVSRQYGSKPFDDAPGSVWEKTSPQTAGSFSAVAYYFAKKLQDTLKVPVGIVYAAWGGTPAEAWTPNELLHHDKSLSIYIDRWKKIQQDAGKDSVAYKNAMQQWEQKSNDSSKGKVTLKKPVEPQSVYYFKRPWREPGVLFNGMINPVIPYKMKGVLWYQGESNVSYADEYEYLFSKMIESWRNKWKTTEDQTELPFYFVQIAPFGYSDLDAAARLREAQQSVVKNMKQAGMAVTVDVGNMKDIHYTHKKEVGDRLALIALSKDYGFKKVVYTGPKCNRVLMEGSKAVVVFDQSLKSINGNKAGGFEIGYKAPGNDSLTFVKAETSIEGNKVVVWTDKANKPEMVRYAWLLIDEANLLNKTGLPAHPFRMYIKN